MLMILAVGCSKLYKSMGSFKPDRDSAYLKQNTGPALKLPKDYALDSRYATNYFSIPHGVRPPEGSEPVSIVPPTLLITLETAPHDTE